MAGLKLDSKDFEILSELKENAKQTVNQLSRKTKLPPTTVHNRLKKLKENQVISGYTIQVDRRKLDQAFSVLIFIYLDQLEPVNKKGGLAEQLSKFPQVDSVVETTGSIDMIAKVHGKDMDEIVNIVLNHIRQFKGVRRTETVIALSEHQNGKKI